MVSFQTPPLDRSHLMDAKLVSPGFKFIPDSFMGCGDRDQEFGLLSLEDEQMAVAFSPDGSTSGYQ